MVYLDKGPALAENLIAALVGSSIASMKYTHRGKHIVAQAWLSGFFLSYFTARDVSTLITLAVGVKLSYGASFFLTAYLTVHWYGWKVFIIVMLWGWGHNLDTEIKTMETNYYIKKIRDEITER